MVNSRQKGNRAQREVRTILRDAFGGTWEIRGMGLPGADIIPPDNFPYEPEVKHDKAIRTHHLLNPTTLLTSYWKQTKSQCTRDRLPLLCAKVDGTWYAARPTAGAPTIKSAVGIWAVWDGDQVIIQPIKEFITDHV